MLNTGYKPLKGVKMKGLRFPFFAELRDKRGTLVQVLGAKTEVNNQEYQINGRVIKMPGNVTEKFAYVVLGEDTTQWQTGLEYIRVDDIIIEKEFPEYLV